MSAGVLDTSALIALLRGHAGVAEASRRLDRIVMPVIVLGEILVGRVGAGRKEAGEREIRTFVASPRVEVAPLGVETAVRYAAIRDGLRRAGWPIPANDIWIAAVAMERGLRVLTLDRHYLDIPQVLVEFFEPE